MTKYDDEVGPLPSISNEYATAQLGDQRRVKRLIQVAEALRQAPGQSFPRLMTSGAELEGYYRLVNNPNVNYLDIFEPHAVMTSERAAQVKRVAVLHDSSEFEYQGEVPRRGLGRLRSEGQGFLAHTSLAIAADGSQRPLGVIAQKCWARTGRRSSRTARGRRLSGAEYARQNDKESERWWEGVSEASARLKGRTEVIHVMDREGDAFVLLAQMAEAQERFIVRAAHDRNVGAEVVFGTEDRLSDALQGATLVQEREVVLSKRKGIQTPRAQKLTPDRSGRMATLEIRAMQVVLKRPPYLKEGEPWLLLNVVHVVEKDPPAGQAKVEWKLYTTEPITTAEEVMEIVDMYRARWQIEEYFQALKTGCRLEERQHESYEALVNALAIFIPIAWQALLLRNLSRRAPDTPATAALTEQQIEVLRECSSVKLGEQPTVRQALMAVAQLGGHIKNNGDPGWKVLGRGMERLFALEAGWTAAKRQQGNRKCDG
jgi:hypothetical protein